jgi:triosephosphate isomerase
VGETLEEREAGETQKVLGHQFKGGFHGLTPREISRIILAYEPVWAIGTGRTATPEMAAESHHLLRGFVSGQFGDEAAFHLRILYGGSVKPDNIGRLMAQEEIDGALVGGASLQADSFSAIVNCPRA